MSCAKVVVESQLSSTRASFIILDGKMRDRLMSDEKKRDEGSQRNKSCKVFLLHAMRIITYLSCLMPFPSHGPLTTLSRVPFKVRSIPNP